jgi:hypothetical protein
VELKEEPDITKARGKFEKIRQSLQARGGGLVSVYYHPCEFVHEQFWDAVNFSRGANPSPRQWRLPPQKSPAAIEQAFHNFQAFVRQMKNTPGTRFVAGRELLALYPDSSRQRKFSREEILDMARSVQVEVNFQRRREFILSSAEILSLLNRCLSGFIQEGRIPEAPPIQMAYGPPRLAPESRQDFAVTWDQFASSCLDVQAALEKNQQIPAEIWLGSESIGPADYLVTLAKIVEGLISHGETPKTVTLLRGKLIASQHVADDKSNLWGWVIFPEGFHSPKIMEQAKLQAWTLKPAFFQTTP